MVDTAIFGDKLHVLLGPNGNPADLQPLLERQGMSAGPPRAIAPSLEDVFVQLVAKPS